MRYPFHDRAAAFDIVCAAEGIQVIHLRRVFGAYVAYYNQWWQHQGLAQPCPVPAETSTGVGAITRRQVLGGLMYREPA